MASSTAYVDVVDDAGLFTIVFVVGSSSASFSAGVCCQLVQHRRRGVSQWRWWWIPWRYCPNFRAAPSPPSGRCRRRHRHHDRQICGGSKYAQSPHQAQEGAMEPCWDVAAIEAVRRRIEKLSSAVHGEDRW